MAFERALRYILTHDRHVRAILEDEDRIYPEGEGPQNPKRPTIYYQVVGLAGNTDHAGGGGTMRADQVRLTCWADDYSEAEELRQRVRTALVGQRGTFDGETLHGIFEDSRRAEAEEPADRSEHLIQGATFLLKIWHEGA